MILEFSAEAENDLEQIGDYIAQDDPRRALSFRRVHGNYLIFYRVESEKVVIIHILHGAIDYGRILFGD